MSNVSYPPIGASLIVKNEEATIINALDSIKGHVDYVAIADTGSTDKTIELIQQWGDAAKEEGLLTDYALTQIEWEDNFSKARQTSWNALCAFPVRYGLWLDADDVLMGAENLRPLAAKLEGTSAVGFLMPYNYAQDEHGNCLIHLWRERLIKLRHGEVWRLPIHEVLQVEGQLVKNDDVVWVHNKTHDYAQKISEIFDEKLGWEADVSFRFFDALWNYLPLTLQTDDDFNEKFATFVELSEFPDSDKDVVRDYTHLFLKLYNTRVRNYKILIKDYEGSVKAGKSPDPRTISYLGTELMILGFPDRAIPYFEEYLQVGSWDEELCQISSKLSQCYVATGDLEKASESALQAVRHRPDWADGYLAQGRLELAHKEYDSALRWLDQAESLGMPDTLLIINPMDYEYQILVNKSIAYASKGDLEKGIEYTGKALQVTPTRADLLGQMGKLKQAQKKIETVKHLMSLYRELVHHDEPIKAAKLFECVPYYVEYVPEVTYARLQSRERIMHTNEPTLYAKFYGEAERALKLPEQIEELPRVSVLTHLLEGNTDVDAN